MRPIGVVSKNLKQNVIHFGVSHVFNVILAEITIPSFQIGLCFVPQLLDFGFWYPLFISFVAGIFNLNYVLPSTSHSFKDTM